jgi:hypothetical protein
MKLNKAVPSLKDDAKNNTIEKTIETPNKQEDSKASSEQKEPKNEVFQTSLRCIYSYKNTEEKFDIGTNHKNLLTEIKNMDNTLHIIPNDDEISAYNDLTNFPTDETTFKRHFKVIEETNRITVCHDIITSKKLQDLKYQQQNNQKVESILLQYMKRQNLIVKMDKFNRHRTTSIGILICINPDIVHRDTLHKDLTEALDDIDLHETDYNQFFQDMLTPLKEPPREEMETETHRFAPEFEIGYRSVSYKDTSGTTNIRTLDIQCAVADAQLLKEMFSSLDFSEYYKTMLYIPRGLVKLNNDPLAYKKYIDLHLHYMHNTTQFAIVGLKKTAFEFEIETDHGSFTPKQILFNSPYIEAIHTTANTATKGIWVIATTKENIANATAFFDEEIYKIFEYIPNTDKYIDERNIVPTRIAKQKRLQSTKTLERSEILNKLIPETILVPAMTGNRRPNNKRHIQYDNITTSTKQQKLNDNETVNGKTDTTDITLKTKLSEIQDIETKLNERIRTMEDKLLGIAKQVNENEENRRKTQQDSKNEIKKIIKETLTEQLPANLNNNFNMMAAQIIELNRKFDTLMTKLEPTTNNISPNQGHGEKKKWKYTTNHQQKMQLSSQYEKKTIVHRHQPKVHSMRHQ